VFLLIGVKFQSLVLNFDSEIQEGCMVVRFFNIPGEFTEAVEGGLKSSWA